MNGKRLATKNTIITALILLCTMALSRQAIGAGKTVSIFLSDDEKAYETPVATFTSEIDLPVKVYNLHGDIKKAAATMAEIFASDTSLIFALGAKAAYIAKVWTIDRQEIPVVFALVLNWERYNLFEGQKNVAGIAYDVSPDIQLANMTMFSPQVRRIGVIYSKDHSAQIFAAAERASKLFNVQLVAQQVARSWDFKRSYKEIGENIDGFWLLADPVIYTMDNVSWLEQKCIKDKLACIGQSENIAKFGVLLAVDPDMHSIGSQAASIGKSILKGKRKPADIGVMSPLGTRLLLNLKTAKKIGLDVSPAAKDIASEIIDN